ncbi:ABC transporter ATP-binding protein [Sporolactobacillus nakayamae]|uniref:ABC-type nitrate/sulfonate/bicarbonate transport system, ATPase component n=1 Tax=Sporolactobacillus nakayamae TaxID=269670 RepID=A0A1I2V908_9BACL|nr:ABC transporter ATP-binding protein [Sporolactobacillus nakayamae]SFG85523.1 ABC-type nitrate/sulfonate/bicarbonate transport system, ATPase component [Sporolactobacillus nakayamae]
MSELKIVNCSKYYKKNGKPMGALENATMNVENGRFVSIIGPSGCGKSTLFNIIAGLIQPSSGEVLLDGKDITRETGNVGYMLQKDLLLPWRSILDNVIIGLEIRGIPKKIARERALPMLQKYGLGGFEYDHPDALSGGMRQRAGLIRTLLYDKDVILLDEPFGALDAQTRMQMQNWLLQIWSDFKKTILFVTHDIDEAIYLSDEIHVFTHRPGKIKATIEVDLPRPRSEKTLMDDRFLTLKRELLLMLREERVSSE